MNCGAALRAAVLQSVRGHAGSVRAAGRMCSREWGVQQCARRRSRSEYGDFSAPSRRSPRRRAERSEFAHEQPAAPLRRPAGAREKNTQTLFEAFALLEQSHPAGDFHLLVIGDGQERDQLCKLLSNGATAYRWIPYCADAAELARYYRAADLFVHPGVEETFGLVALESQACGTPGASGFAGVTWTTLFCTIRRWAHENTAAAAGRRDREECARSISLRFRSGGRGIGRRALYGWPRVFERLFCIYREVLRKLQEGVTDMNTTPTLRHSQLPRRPIARRSGGFVARPDFWASRSTRFMKTANCSRIS